MADNTVTLVFNAQTGQVVSSIQNVKTALGDLDKKTKSAQGSLQAFSNNFASAGMAAMAFGLELKKGFDLAFNFAKHKQSIEAMEKQFGVSSDAMLAKLKQVSGGTVGDADLILAANKSMALGVTGNVETMGKLMEYARLRARAMGIDTTFAFDSIVTGIGRGSPLILDNLGIITKGWDEQAKQAGVAMDKNFILSKVLKDANVELKRNGELILTDAERLMAMNAQAENAKIVIGEALLPIFGTLAMALQGVLKVFSGAPKVLQAVLVIVPFLGIAILALTKIVMAFGIAFSAAIWPITAVVAGIAGAIVVVAYLRKNWEAVTIYFALSIKKTTREMNYLWAAIKFGALNLVKMMIVAAEKVFFPWIAGINLVIDGYNKLTGKNIKNLSQVFTATKDNLDARINAEKQYMAEYSKVSDEEVRLVKELQAAKDKANASGPKAKTSTTGKKDAGPTALKGDPDALQKRLKAITDFNDYVGNIEGEMVARENEKYAKQLAAAKQYGVDREAIEKQHKKNLEDIENQAWTKKIEDGTKGFLAVMEQTKNITSQMSDIGNLYYQNQEIALNNDYAKRKAKIEAEMTDEAQKKAALEALDTEYESKKKKMQRQAAVLQKKFAITEAVINTAVGVSAALRTPPPWVGIALASLVGGLGAAKVALIAKQQIPEAAEGAFVKGSSSGTLVRVGEKNRSEAIVPFENERVMSKFRGGGGGGVTVNLNDCFFATEAWPEQARIKIDRELTKLAQDHNSTFAEAVRR